MALRVRVAMVLGWVAGAAAQTTFTLTGNSTFANGAQLLTTPESMLTVTGSGTKADPYVYDYGDDTLDFGAYWIANVDAAISGKIKAWRITDDGALGGVIKNRRTASNSESGDIAVETVEAVSLRAITTSNIGTGDIGNVLTGHITMDVAHGFRTKNKLSVEQCPPLRLPLLRDVIKLVMQQDRTRLSLQPKDECVEAAFQIIRELKAERWIGFNDGNLRKMQQAKSLDRNITVFWDRGAKVDIAKDIQIALQSGFEGIVVNDRGMTKEIVEQIRKAGLEPGVWTVNSEADMRRFLDMGVQRIYTDYPARLLRLKQAGAGS